MDGDRIKEHLMAFAQASYLKVEDGGPHQDHYVQTVERTCFRESGFTSSEFTVTFMPFRYFGHGEMLVDLQETKELIKVLNEEGASPPTMRMAEEETPEGSPELIKIILKNDIFPLLKTYVEEDLRWGREDTFEGFSNEEVFLGIADRYIHYWGTETIQYHALTPVQGFSANRNVLEIDENLSLHRMQPADKTELYRIDGSDFTKDFLSNSSFMIASIYEGDRDHPRIDEDILSKHRALLEALRLYSSPTPSACWMVKKPNPSIQPVSGSIGTSFFTNFEPPKNLRGRPVVSDRLELGESQYGELRTLYEQIRVNGNELEYPIRWLNESYGRPALRSRDDAFVDLVISLESSAGSRHSVNSVGRALRIAWLMKSEQSPKATNDTVHTITKTRNDIIHNSISANQSIDGNVNEPLKEGQELTRKLLRTYLNELEDYESIEELHDSTDLKIKQRLSSDLDYSNLSPKDMPKFLQKIPQK